MQGGNETRLEEGVKEKAACEGEVWVGGERRRKRKQAKRMQREGHTSGLIDKHTHANTGKGHTAIPATRHSDKLVVKCSISHPN